MTEPLSDKTTSTVKQPLHVAQLNAALLKIETVIAVSGLSKSHIYAKLKAGTFPAPVRLGARCTRWRSADLHAWLLQVGQ
jgi:prophage regulatory protein